MAMRGGGGGGGRRLPSARPEGDRTALLRRTAAMFRPYGWALSALVLLLLTTTALDLLGVRMLGMMVDRMAGGASLGSLDRLFALYLSAVVGSSLLGVVLSFVNQSIGQGVMHRLRSRPRRGCRERPGRFSRWCRGPSRSWS